MWLGLTRRTMKTDRGEVGVRPVVGVRHEPLMRVYAAALPSVNLRLAQTVSTTLPTLLGDAAFEWVFLPGEDIAVVADDMCRSIVEVALPWCASLIEPRAIRQVVFERKAAPSSFSDEQILPLLDVFCDDAGSALRRLKASVDARRDRQDMEAREFREFADGLTRQIRDNCAAW